MTAIVCTEVLFFDEFILRQIRNLQASFRGQISH